MNNINNLIDYADFCNRQEEDVLDFITIPRDRHNELLAIEKKYNQLKNDLLNPVVINE